MTSTMTPARRRAAHGPRVARLAARIAAGMLAGLIIFQVALAAGAPLGHAAWGGAHPSLPTSLRLATAVPIASYALGAIMLLRHAGYSVGRFSPSTVGAAPGSSRWFSACPQWRTSHHTASGNDSSWDPPLLPWPRCRSSSVWIAVIAVGIALVVFGPGRRVTRRVETRRLPWVCAALERVRRQRLEPIGSASSRVLGPALLGACLVPL
jgi:hypothetical protein